MIHIMLFCVAYMIGIIWGLYLNFGLGIVFFFLFICVSLYINKKIIYIILIISLISSGITIYNKYQFNNKYINGNISFNATVISNPIEEDYYYSYEIKNNSSNDKFILNTKKDNIKLKYGMVIRINNAKFSLPDLPKNKGGFNYRYYLNSKYIYGYIKADKSNIEIINEGKENIFENIRKNIKNTFLKLLPKDQASILIAMTIGDRDIIEEHIDTSFRNSGILHLLSISGAHLVYIVISLKFISKKIFGKNISNYICVIGIILFMAIAESSPSLVRACIMSITVILSEIISKKPNIYASISFSAILILIYNPYSICNVGFVLSYVSTLGIIILYKNVSNMISKYLKIKSKIIIDSLSISISAQIMILPITAYYFNSISLISVITNLIITPIVGILLILAFIVAILGLISINLAAIFSYPLYILNLFLITISNIFSSFQFSNILVPTPKIIEIIIYYSIMGYLLNKNKFKINSYIDKTLKISLVTVILTSIIIDYLPKNYLEITMINVGQGDSIYIESKSRKTILIDGGGSENSNYDVGESILLPYLLDRRKMKIDLVVATHAHEDHMEGLITIISKLKVNNILIGAKSEDIEVYNNFIKIAKEKNINIIEAEKSDMINIDGIIIKIISPDNNLKLKDNLNDSSLVIKLIYNNITALFTGDIEKETEEILAGDISSNILKVAHHGSITSSTDKFLNKVNPSICIIGVGKNNSFGHPSRIVLDRLQNIGSKIYRTDVNGEIQIKIYEYGNIKVNTLY